MRRHRFLKRAVADSTAAVQSVIFCRSTAVCSTSSISTGVWAASNARLYSAGAAQQPSLATLVSKLRKELECPMHVARSALESHNRDYEKAKAFILQQQASVSSEKLGKLEGRVSGKEGLIGVWSSAPGTKATSTLGGLIEMHCETDFVARSTVFGDLIDRLRADLKESQEVTESSKVKVGLEPLNLESYLTAPMASSIAEASAAHQTPRDLITASVSKVGEGVILHKGLRARLVPSTSDVSSFSTIFSLAPDTAALVGTYAHAPSNMSSEEARETGRLAVLVLLQVPASNSRSTELQTMARRLAQQVAGFQPTCIDESEEGGDASSSLLNMPFLGAAGQTVKQVTETAGVKVLAFERFALGE